MGVGAAVFGSGLALGGLGIHMHELWMLCLGYGVLGGTGVGLAYTPAIGALMAW